MGELIDKVKGNIDEAVGKAKQAIARDSDDPKQTESDAKLKGEGAMQEIKGKGEQFIGKVKGALGDDI